MQFVTLQTYTYSTEMAIVRSLLDSEGIDTFVRDEMISQVNPFYSNAVGGIKLQVLDKDYDKALDILIAKGFLKSRSKPANEDNLSELTVKQRQKIYIIVSVLIIFTALVIYYIFQKF